MDETLDWEVGENISNRRHHCQFKIFEEEEKIFLMDEAMGRTDRAILQGEIYQDSSGEQQSPIEN